MAKISFKNPMALLTQDRQEQKNLALLGTRNVLRMISSPFIIGDVTTPFHVAVGMTPAIIAAWSIPGQLLGLFMTFVGAAYGDRFTNRIRATVIMTLGTIIAPAGTLLVLLGPPCLRELTAVMAITTGFGLINTVFARLYAVVEPTVEARAIHNEVRGRFWGIFGIISGLLGIGVGVITTYLLKTGGPFKGYAVSIVIGIVLIFISAMLFRWVKELPDLAGRPLPKKERPSIGKSLLEVVRLKEFRILMPANFFRGMGNGAAGYIMLLAFQRMSLPPEYGGYAAIILQVSIFISYIVIYLTMDRFGVGIVMPVTEILLCVGMMTTAVTNNPMVFLGALLLYRVMNRIEEIAVPLAHYSVVPVEVMGAFSAVRLGLLNITGAFSGTIIGICLKWVAPQYVFLYCCVMKLLCGFLFSYGVLSVRRHIAAKTAAEKPGQ